MSVKEKAKAFEAIQSVTGESPPPRKKSREELIGDISVDNDIPAKHTSPPVPPPRTPRKCKANGTLRQPGDSSPYTERKENIPAIIPAKPPISTNPPTQQSNATGQKKKTRPPPPPRGSSLGRKSTMSANTRSLPGGKKPRPPVPPKPKNYVPKKFSAPGGVNVKKEVQSDIQTTKERSDSVPMDATSSSSDVQDSKFFLNQEKGRYILSAVPYKRPNADNSSQFFVPLDKQTYDNSVRTEDTESEKQMSSPTVTMNVANDEEINSVENNTADNYEVRENGVVSPHTRSTFYDLSEELSTGKESPDLLEGLEIEVEAVSDDQDEEFSKPIREKKRGDENLSHLADVNGEVALENFGIVVKEQSCSESMPADSGDDSKENIKVVFSLLLEEECSVSVVDDAVARQNIVDVTVQPESEGKESEDTSEWSNKRENVIDRELSDKTTEQTTLTEPPFSVNQDTENVSQSGVKKPTEDTQPCDVDIVSEKLIDNTQVNVVEDELSIDELKEPTVEQNIELEADSQLENSELQTNEQVNQESEVVNSSSTKLSQNEPQENREIIVAEPIKDGTFISVSDLAIPEGTAGLAEEVNPELRTKESALDEKEESERSTSLSESVTVALTDVENPAEQISDEAEGDDKNDTVQLQLNLGGTSSQQVESNDVEVEVELGNEEKSREHLVNDQVIDKECMTQTENIDSVGGTEGLEQVESGKTMFASVAEHTVKETCTVNDFATSTEGLEDSVNVVAPVEIVDIKEPESQENKDDDEPQSPSFPEPVPPERKSRKNRQGKHAYENVDIVIQGGNLQQGEKKKDSLPKRSHSFSRYETVVFSQPHPVQRVSDDEAIYRVPGKVIPVRSYADDESVYSVPCAIPTHHVDEENEYSVPKPIIVQAHTVMDRQKADEDGEIYAVPGLPTAVPVETFPEPSSKEVVNAIAQESDNIYVVPAQQNTVTTVTAKVSTAPPPKPPRMSLCEQDKKVDLEEVTSKESPKPVPRMRVVGDATPESKEGKASPSPAPRKGFKTETSESTPSPVPRKGSRTSQTDSESATPPGSGSPVPVPRTRLNALQYNKEAAFSPPAVQSSSEFSTEESTCTEDEATSRRKAPAPPRPPPPVYRISITNSEGSIPAPLSPGLGIDSDSDSDVGEEEAPKGPPKPKTYHIVHEILSTERTFVDALKLVFEECYGIIKSANVVADSVLADIFRDLENIYLLDSRFLQELEERMVTWEEHERIGDIIKKYGHFLKMYTQYVNGYDKAMSVFQETMKENPEFANLVSQFQASERCHGMILSAYMLKPVQRIPSYRLLLIDYLKHLPKDSEEYEDTEAALKIVSEVATHINESMKKMDSFEQLLKLQNMLVGHPEIVKAGRDYLKEGMLMKLCRKDMQERMFFLLTDVLLYTTPIGANQYKLNKRLPLLGMQVTVPDSPDFVNEFSIISTTRSFTLTSSTPDERDNWVEALNNAIDVVTQRKTTFIAKTRDAAGLLEQDGEVGKLGEKAPVWIPDARVTMCMSCTSPFTLTNRRHHCRACGNVVCGSCSESTAPLVYLDYTEARVCDKCYDMLLKEFHTHEIHVDVEEVAVTLPPLLQEAETAEKLLRKPTKFEMMRRFKSKKSKRKSQIIHPTHLTEVVANQEGIQMSGYLRFKKGRHGWKKCWFVLKDRVLYSYKASSDVVALDTMPVLGYKIEDLGKEGDDFAFQLKHQGVQPIVFKADNETSAKRWVGELTKATTMQG